MNSQAAMRQRPRVTGKDAIRFTKRCKENEEFLHSNLHNRLIADKAIDMRDNYLIEDLGNGYVKVKPIDPSKLYT